MWWRASLCVSSDNKGWELVEQARKESDKVVEEMADSIYFSSPEARASYVKPTTAETKWIAEMTEAVMANER